MSQQKKNYSLASIFPSLPKVERGKFVKLGGDPKQKNFLYCNGNNVYIRNIEDCAKCDVYYEHTTAVTVAKYAPSGFYIASGDVSGKVRIWDTVNEEHILKNEFPVLGGPVRDIAWSPDSTKICIVGEGREFFAKTITMDMGTTVGDMGGHSKHVNAAAYKPTRPFRIATASEDQVARFYEGPPFKYNKTLNDHSNFVNCVKYHPKGDVFITGGADGQAFVFDGATAELIGPLGGNKAHGGGIYALDFSDDGAEVITASGDRSAKIWNVASREMVVEFKFGKDLTDMMVGCLWQGDNIIVLPLSGYLIYLDRNNPAVPRKTLKGHYKPIISMAATPDRSYIYTGSTDGEIYGWNVSSGMSDLIEGKGHTNQVMDMAIVADTLVTIGMDDVIRYTQLEGAKSQYRGDACKLPSMPRNIAAKKGGVTVVACIDHIAVVENGHVMFEQKVPFEPTCVDLHPDGGLVAFGTNKDHNIWFYNLDGTSLTHLKKQKVEDTVSCIKFSPDGRYLVATGSTKRRSTLLEIVSSADAEMKEIYALGKQTAKIFSLAWSPCNRYYATGSLDGSIVVWRLDRKYEANVAVYIRDAHLKSYVSGLVWLSERLLVSSGHDSNVKHWALDIE